MNTRRDFLDGLFHLLQARDLDYCVLRNYNNLFASAGDLDVDLLVEKPDVRVFDECLTAAATSTGQRLVQRVRHVNHSRTFLSGEQELTRIDFDTELRWRLLPILGAREILAERRKQDGFYIPHPRHELMVVLTQVAWKGKLTDRYRQRIADLANAIDAEELRRTYRAAFGGPGIDFQKWHSAGEQTQAQLPAQLRRSLARKALKNPLAWAQFFGHALTDAARFFERWRRPKGVSVLCLSVREPRSMEDLLRRLEFLFPADQWFRQPAEVRAPRRRERRRVLFKGGVFLENHRVAGDEDLSAAIKADSHIPQADRQFIYAENSQGQGRWIHAGSGYEESIGHVDPWLIGFMADLYQSHEI